MTTQKIKKLVLESYKKDILDKKRVIRIGKFLNRKDFKQYVRLLKTAEAKKTVTVWAPTPLTLKEKQKISRSFKNKKISYITDQSLGLGLKIVNNDDVFDFTLKSELENMVSQIRV